MVSKISVNNLKNGNTFKKNNQVYVLLDSSHSKSGRGQAHVKARVRNLKTDSVSWITFTSSEFVESAYIDKKKMKYLYSNGESLIFNDENFNEFSLSVDIIGDKIYFLVAGEEVLVFIYENEIIGVEFDKKVKLKVVKTPELAVKGNTVSNATKKAILETDLEIDIPQFVQEGDYIIVSTETKKYLSKA